MKKIVVILLCIWTMVLLTGCNSDATKELNPFEQTSLNKTGKYEVLSQEGYITPTCYVYMDDLAMGLYERSFMEDDIFISGVSVTNEGVDPINISDTLRISVTQSGSELEIVPEYYSPSDIQLQPQETTIITEYYYLKNRRAHIDIEVISLDKTSPVIVSTYYEVYRGSASIVPYNELQNSNGNTTPLFFTRIQNIYNEPNMNCFIELPNEWLDAIALEEEESYGMWTAANRIIVDVYNKIAGISTVLAGLMSAVAVVGAKLSNNQHKVDQAWDWLRRIWIAWAVINGIGAFIAYVAPLFQGLATIQG